MTYEGIIAGASAPLDPITTDVTPRLPVLKDVRAVLFDIYGTLLVSASGDIGAGDSTSGDVALAQSFAAIGQALSADLGPDALRLRDVIESHHKRLRAEGVEYPEVDIVAVWQELCGLFDEQGQLRQPLADIDFRRLAVEYEVRTNPVWPMPGMSECISAVRETGRVMGIISNAQFFTPEIFPAIAGKSLDQLGFDRELRYYSYEHGWAKPGPELFDMAVGHLTKIGIRPEQVLYVGNDMRNDIWPATDAGFRTVLFAGDQRSLRLRANEAERHEIRDPSAIVTHLMQIPSLLDTPSDTSNDDHG